VATAQDIVTRAFRALSAIDINEQPTPNEAQVGLDSLEAMIAAWGTGLNVADQTLTGTTALDSPEVADIDTTGLSRGFNVSGTGIPAATRIKSIDAANSKIVLTANATASGTSSLIFTLLPFEAKHEQGVIALLALQLAPQVPVDNIPAMVVRNAQNGMASIRAQFFPRVPLSGNDLPRNERLVKPTTGTDAG
jgi:hypothetical protein